MAEWSGLEKMSWELLNTLTADELRKVIQKGLITSFSRMRRLTEVGYELGDYNKNFIAKVGETRSKSITALKNMDRSDLLSEASYVKRHLMSEESSISGKRLQEERLLSTLNRLSGDRLETRRYRDGSYQLGDRKITREEMKKFGKVLNKVKERHAMDVLRGGTNDGLDTVRELYFGQNIDNASDILEFLDNLYKEEQLSNATKQEQFDKALESVKSKNMMR